MRANITIPREVFNPVYFPYLNCKVREQLFYGGSSSGKSVFISQRSIMDMFAGGRNYLVIRNTANSIRSSAYNELNKRIVEWDSRQLFDINKTEMTFTCRNGYQILCKGLDDIEKLKSITPAKGVITDLWIEEATEISYNDFKNLIKRLRGRAGVPKRIILSFNPILKTHWIYKEFFSGFNDATGRLDTIDRVILRTTHKDNTFLDPEDHAALERETDSYYYDVYTLGKWGVVGDVIFKNWRTENLSGMKDAFSVYRNGLDFGFTNDPTVAVRMGVKFSQKKIYIPEAIYDYGMLNNVIAARVKPLIGSELIRCDAAEPKSIAELRALGLNAVAAIKGPGSVNHGIQYLQQFEIIIHEELQQVLNDIELYQWKKNKDGIVLNEPIDKDNHAPDAMRYGMSADALHKEEEKTPSIDYRIFGLS